MQYLTLLTLPLLSAAFPTLRPRAGAPTAAPLPSDCAIVSTYPSPNITSFAPTSNFTATALYSYTLSPGASYPNDGTNDTAAVQQCLETCYGYGDPGECKSVWTAHGVNEQVYGSTVYAEFVCKLFGTTIGSSDLGPQNRGEEDANAHALTIGCGPRSE